MKKEVANHATTKQCHIRTFSSFLAKNYGAPFVVKNVVRESALSIAILYSCETWMVKDITTVQTQYMSSVKDLLGVRTQTPSNLIYAELDILSVHTFVRRKQISFLKKVKNSTHFEGSPLQKAIQMAKDSQSTMGHYIKDLEALDGDPVDEISKIIEEHVTNSDSSRSVVYRELNPMLSLHPMYHSGVCETYRVMNFYAYMEMGISNHKPTFLFIVNIPEP